MQVVTVIELESILSSVWLANAEHEALAKYLLSSALIPFSHLVRHTPPVCLPWSQSFYLCCRDVGSLLPCAVPNWIFVAVANVHTEVLPVRGGCGTTPRQHRRPPWPGRVNDFSPVLHS